MYAFCPGYLGFVLVSARSKRSRATELHYQGAQVFLKRPRSSPAVLTASALTEGGREALTARGRAGIAAGLGLPSVAVSLSPVFVRFQAAALRREVAPHFPS